MGNGFHLRLVGALLLTLATVGFIQYQVLARDARERLIEDERKELTGDAAGVATAYSTTVQGQPPLKDTSARAVLASITTFARQTGAYVIAEGIETEEMLEMVHDAHGVQGYLLGRPGELPSPTGETGSERLAAGAALQVATH